ncbi:MAG: methyltransferase domain-containing protein [Thermodesulfobacteriota bacterium]
MRLKKKNNSVDNRCRFCESPLEHIFVDLGMSPLCESFVPEKSINCMEAFFPLRVHVCSCCFLVQLEEYVSPENIFKEYAYFSSYSDTWLQHSKNYTEKMIPRFGLNSKSQVIEIASNDGYLLQYFVMKDIPVLGIEPAINVAQVAINKSIPTRTIFFNESSARQLNDEGIMADLLVGNNVLAQVPDLNSFIRGMKFVLKPAGVITMEFPHLMRLVEGNQFDTIYHEHFSYFSFISVEKIFAAHGFTLFDVEELATHGGSIRIYVCHENDKSKSIGAKVKEIRSREIEAGLTKIEYYFNFSKKVEELKRDILDLLIGIKRSGKSIVGYGAPGKGNTLLNYCGIRTDFIDYTVDRNPYKQGKYLPGTHIPVYSPDKISETKPDFLFVLPWNLKDEIMTQMSYIREWGGKFIVPIPRVSID